MNCCCPTKVVSKTDLRMKVDVLVPGFSKRELKVRAKEEPRVLVVKGKVKNCEEEAAYKRQPFKLEIPVSGHFDLNTVSVSLKRGVLRISVLRTEASKGSLVEINNHSSANETDSVPVEPSDAVEE